jgi:hypothetical protein
MHVVHAWLHWHACRIVANFRSIKFHYTIEPKRNNKNPGFKNSTHLVSSGTSWMSTSLRSCTVGDLPPRTSNSKDINSAHFLLDRHTTSVVVDIYIKPSHHKGIYVQFTWHLYSVSCFYVSVDCVFQSCGSLSSQPYKEFFGTGRKVYALKQRASII